MTWTDYLTAPEPGTPICKVDDVQGVLPLAINTEKGNFPLLVVRIGDHMRAYVNACPH